MTLTQEQLDALSNLARKKAGEVVGWVAIAPARELTELGLAARNPSGWHITTDGEAALERLGNGGNGGGSDHRASPLVFPSGDRGTNR